MRDQNNRLGVARH